MVLRLVLCAVALLAVPLLHLLALVWQPLAIDSNPLSNSGN